MISKNLLQTIDFKIDRIESNMFTKADMETFRRDVCNPSCQAQKETEKMVNGLRFFQARIYGMVAAISVIFTLAIVIIELKLNTTVHH